MIYRCSSCGESYEDEWLLTAHYEIYHNVQEIDRPSVISYAPPADRSLPIPSTSQVLTANYEIDRPSVISYASPANRPQPIPSTSREEDHELVAEALEGKVVRHFRIKNGGKKPLNTFLKEAKKITRNILQEELTRLNFLKIGIVLDSTFVNQQNETSPRSFISKNRVLMETTNLDEIIDEMHQEIVQKITEHEGRGS